VNSHEHGTIGDDASGGALVSVVPERADAPLALRYGDVVALAGDFFLPVVAPSTPGSVLSGTAEEIRAALGVMRADAGVTERRDGAGRPAPAADADVERRVRDRFIALAAQNADHFTAPWADERPLATEREAAGRFDSAPAAYRRLHQVALDVAYREGLQGGDLAAAMAHEAAAQHYLTDAFAAGHVRTPVAAIRRFWRRRYPDFWERLLTKVARDTTAALRDLAPPLRLLPRSALEQVTLQAVHNRTRALPAIFLGDLLARVFHDWDNDRGLLLEDGQVLFGDGHVEEGAGRELAVRAVRAGLADVEVAHRLGRNGRELLGDQLYAEVVDITRGGGTTFTAEVLLPRLSSDNPPLNWRAADADELWDAPVAGSRGPTVGEAAGRALDTGGEVYRRLAGLGVGVADSIDVPAARFLRRYLGPRAARAYREGFVDQLSHDPRGAVRDIVGSVELGGERHCCSSPAVG
jgi:hypothetical protein